MPYKIERLKPIYLFILLTTIFSLGLFTEKTLVQTVFSKKERIEEIMVGDVNDTMDYSFEVNWNDTEFEANRPTSVTYNLYNVLDENTVVSTVTLTPSNADPNDANKWVGTFNSVRKYNDDESFATYIIKQQEIENYVQKYDSKNIDTLCIKFGDNVFNGDTNKSIKFIGTIKYIRYETGYHYDTWDHYYVKNNRTDGNEFYYEDLANKTICVYAMMGEKAIYIEGKENNLDIEDIYYADRKYDYDEGNPIYDWHSWTTYHIDEYDQYIDKDYPNNPKNEMNRYVLDNHYDNYPGANIITNNYNKINFKFDAYWEDEGHENNRPSSAEYYLYRKDNQNNILKTITLTSANADPNDSHHWIGYFNDVDGYNEDGSPIEYVVRQKDVANYINSYDSNEGYSITFNEQAITGHYSALQIWYYDPINDVWSKYKIDEYISGIGEMISGKTFNIKFDKEYNFSYDSWEPIPYDYRNPRLVNFETHKVEHFVGDNYPESHHPINLYEYFNYEYRYSLSNHTKQMYLFYNGASWGEDYGIKFDSIKTIGNENIVTSRYNVRDLEITKKWEDNGHESERPTSTTVDIYDAKDSNKIVKTVEIKSTDKVDNYTWKKVITDLPIYDKDLQEIEYMIKERTVNGYKVIYDFDDYYNTMAIKFADDIKLDKVYFLFKSDNEDGSGLYRTVFCPGGNLCYNEHIKDRTIYIPKRKVYMFLYDPNHPDQDFTIEDITLTHIDGYDDNFYEYNTKYDELKGHIISDTTYENYPYIDFDVQQNKWYLLIYEWNGSTIPKKNTNVIINKYDKTTFDFKKVWDDVGNEDGRPESIKYSIYNEKDLNTVVKAMSLTNANQNPNNRYEWNGTFINIPKYNSDGSIAKYVVKEEVLDKYKTEHEKEFDSICVKFGNDVFGGDDTRTLNFYVRNKDDLSYVFKLRNENAQSGNNPADFYISDLQNKEVCLPLVDGYNDFYLVSEFEREEITMYIYGNPYYETVRVSDLRDVDITDIYRKNTGNIYHYEPVNDDYYIGYLYSRKIVEFSNETELPKATEEDQHIHYTWIGDNFNGRTIITNHANMREEGYIKEFNDTGYEYNRPKELVFGLYVENDPIPKEMVTVNTSACINNKCNIEFKNVRDKDNDNNQINYIIKEISDYGYDVTYENDKVINTANPVEVKFRKENVEKELLAGAKFEIYNKSNEKIYEFTSTNSEMKVKLLPSSYTIKEVTPPEGYTRSNDINFIVNKDGTITINDKTESVVSIVNEPVKSYYDIILKKTMKGNDNKEFTFEVNIEGVEDPLEYTGSKTGTITNGKGTIKLGANETITIKNIPAASKYEIKELESDYEVEIVGESNGTLERNETIEFINKPKEIPNIPEEKEETYIPDEKESPTPITGLYNITTYIIGILLLIASIFLIVYSKKQITKKEIN